VSGTVLSTEEITVNTTDKVPALVGLHPGARKQTTNITDAMAVSTMEEKI